MPLISRKFVSSVYSVANFSCFFKRWCVFTISSKHVPPLLVIANCRINYLKQRRLPSPVPANNNIDLRRAIHSKFALEDKEIPNLYTLNSHDDLQKNRLSNI